MQQLQYTCHVQLLCSKTHVLCIYCLQDVQSKRSFGIHCCTFTLSAEPLDEPPKLLEKAKRAAGLSHEAFVTLQHGGMLQTANGVDLNKPLTMS